MTASQTSTFHPDSQVARDNLPRWDSLSKAGVLYARPFLELDEAKCQSFLNSNGFLDSPAGKDVLVLAGGGGQQGACFAWLGAKVTVFDLSSEQLSREREAAEVHGYEIRLEQGDMRDLSRFAKDTFDIVFHPHSINFVPNVNEVFASVARVLRPGSQYKVALHNPYTQLVAEENFHPQLGYGLLHPYRDQEVDLEAVYGDDQWVVDLDNGEQISVDHPRCWVHTLSTFSMALFRNGFSIECLSEYSPSEYEPQVENPEPGSWDHFVQVTCPYLRFWTRLKEKAN